MTRIRWQRPGAFTLLGAVLALSMGVAEAQRPGAPPPRAILLAPVVTDAGSDAFPIDLPTALRLVDASNPLIAIARERVEQAYQRQQQANVKWLPTLQAGGQYLRHDGPIQNSAGDVFNSNRWSAFGGGGALARVDTADALFAPLVARRLTRAEAASARAVGQQTQLDVALTYQDLLDAQARLAINAETLANAQLMLKSALAAELAGVGKTPADGPRARAEVELRRVERQDLEVRSAEVSARLAQLLLLPPTVELRPIETTVVPIILVTPDLSLDDLVAIGLRNRPELAQSRALVDATLMRWRQAKVAPLMPRLDLNYFGGSFTGGQTTHTADTGGRGDGTAAAYWELHGLGFADLAYARELRSVHNEALYRVQNVQAQVAAEVAAGRAIRLRLQALGAAQEAVRQALVTWQRLRDASFGVAGPDRRFDPLEPLLAEQQIATARVAYLFEVISFNKAQFRLYTALGQPAASALPCAQALAVDVPTVPQEKQR